MRSGLMVKSYSFICRIFINRDIAGAHNAGLRTVWINRNGKPDADGFATYQIKDITELCKAHIV